MSLYSTYFGRISVKDPTYGAKGDGVTDDTVAIQAALNAAYGTPGSPHGVANPFANFEVYFPPGYYKVSSPAPVNITGASSNGGKIKLAVSSVTGLATNAAVNVADAVGTGGFTANVNRTWYIASIDDSTHITLAQSVIGTQTWTSGGTVTAPALQIRGTQGAHIFGAGRFTTKIENTTANGSVFSCNGLAFSVVERLNLVSAGTGGVAFDLNWDNISPQNSQSVSFNDMVFTGAKGLQIGAGNFQCSEVIIKNCEAISCTVAGIAVMNSNALGITILGGNYAQCAIALWIFSGSAPIIHGVAFQGSTDTDIAIDNTANDAYSIKGCRSESTNFCRFHAGPQVHMAGCSQIAAAAGVFAFIEAGGAGAAPGTLCVDNCYSQNGIITGNGTLYIRGNPSGKAFGNAGYLGSFTGTTPQNI